MVVHKERFRPVVKRNRRALRAAGRDSQYRLDDADALFVGAGSGLSTAVGLTYAGERFRRRFDDFAEAYGIKDVLHALENQWSSQESLERPSRQGGMNTWMHSTAC